MTGLGTTAWLDDLEEERRRRYRHALIGSGIGHVLLIAMLAFAPEPDPIAFPQAITVDLVAALPTAPAAAPAPPKPDPAPVPPPPPPKPQVKILPKDAPTPVAKPKPKPKPEVKRRERPKELSYEDALASLREDLGEQTPAPEPVVEAEAKPTAAPAPVPGSKLGIPVAPEVAAWNLAVMRHIRENWPVPAEFRDSGLAAQLVIDVGPNGAVLGAPKVVRSSGNPYFDDNAESAVLRASPLPAPPQSGRRTLIFTSEE